MPTLNERWFRFTARHDVACPGCRYNLRGLKELYCPECGRTIDPGALMYVGEDEPAVRGLMDRLGVLGALGAAMAVQAIGGWLYPGAYGWVIGLGDPTNVLRVIDIAITAPVLLAAALTGLAVLSDRLSSVIAPSAWADRVLAVSRGRAGRFCWILAMAKAATLAAVVALAWFLG